MSLPALSQAGAGAGVRRAASWNEVDTARLRGLIESAFGRQPRPGVLSGPVLAIYVVGDYRGAALVMRSPLGPYLSKFAVDSRARGQGVGRVLWEALTEEMRPLLWRCRPDNPIATWYVAHCDGMLRTPDWQVFWRGLKPEELPRAVAYVLSRPPDF